MESVNQNDLDAARLAQRLKSQDQTEREVSWNLILRKRTSKRWISVLLFLMDVLVHTCGVEGAQVTQQWVRALAQQRSTPEGDPGYRGFALALRS